MISKTFAKLGRKIFWSSVLLLKPVMILAADQPVPTDAPPDFAPPAGPPPPPPLPIDDYVLPMFVIACFVVFFFYKKKSIALQ